MPLRNLKNNGGPRVLGLLVVYEKSRVQLSIDYFNSFLFENFNHFDLKVISNNYSLAEYRIGSNKCGEFSGWSELIDHENLLDYDLIIFANDTFYLNDKFNDYFQKQFIKALRFCTKRHSNYIIGQLGWHINYELLKKGEIFLIKWIRTSFFAMSASSLKKISGISICDSKLNALIKNGEFDKLEFDDKLPKIISQRIYNWLYPRHISEGWHGAATANKETLNLKARCVLQEILLTWRCVKADISIHDTSSYSLKKEVFNFIFRIQNIFLLNARS